MKKILFILCACFTLVACQQYVYPQDRIGKSPEFITHKDPNFLDLLFQDKAVNVVCKQLLENFDPNYRLYDESVFNAVRNAKLITISPTQASSHDHEKVAREWLKKHGAKGHIQVLGGPRCDRDCSGSINTCCPIDICFDY